MMRSIPSLLLSFACGSAAFALANDPPAAIAQTPAPAKPAAAAAQGTDPLPLVAEGRKLIAAGKVDEGLAGIDRALAIDPKLFEAHLAKGIGLDIKADYAGARTHLEQALALASDDDNDPAITALAVSYVFAGDVENAARQYQKLFDRYIAGGRLDTAVETANALGRVYLETGDIAKAEQWYQTGRETFKKVSGLPEEQIDLGWMRWHHAASRIAARRGNAKQAARDALVVKELIAKNARNATQQPIYDYLIGYNAFYAGDYDAAIAALLKADQRDAFINGLLAQAYEKKGDRATARAHYQKALDSPSHSVQNALTRPLAQKRLAALK